MSFNRNDKENGVSKIKGKRKRKSIVIWRLGFVVFVISCIAFWFFIKEYNRKPQSIVSVKADYELVDTLLVSEFESNGQLADKKYKGKIVLVNGLVKKVVQKEAAYTISFGSSLSPSSILCSIDSTQNAGKITEGKQALIKGLYVGFNHDEILGSDVILNRCILVNN
jgi:hypothetical protein